ncbi:MAG: HRDC domain-containing protein, partial [Candidatus Eremiobacteraeota bacterium]|nr:HRDC domain-containing protein [Candidatus Eremiobacteraeota bacterium]
DVEGFGGLVLTPAARPVLKGEESIRLRRDPEAKKARAPRTSFEGPVDSELWSALRQKRLELARAQGVPPYLIFHDSTLHAMVVERPKDMRAFASLPGVGSKKLDSYGEAFLSVLEQH